MQEQFWKLVIVNNNPYFEKVLDLIKNTARQQEQEYQQLSTRFEAQKPEWNQPGYTWEEYLGELGHEHDETQNILHKSFVITMVMFMESKLLELCNHLQKEFQYPSKVSDIKGVGGMSRSIKYLKNNGVIFPKDAALKSEFEFAFRIRNNLVHANGKINSTKEERKVFGDRKVGAEVRIFNDELDFPISYLESLLILNQKICSEISDNWLSKAFL